MLDAGPLVGFERNDRRSVAIVARALFHEDPLVIPAGVVAQVWRDANLLVYAHDASSPSMPVPASGSKNSSMGLGVSPSRGRRSWRTYA